MDFKKLISIVGKPGLYLVANQRQDGIIVKPVGEGKSQFISARTNQFTLLENISIYTDLDTEPLFDIYEKMLNQEADHSIPDPKKSNNDELKSYFEKILPDYDKERVYTSDIKKLIKWFHILKADLPAMIKDRKGESKSEEE